MQAPSSAAAKSGVPAQSPEVSLSTYIQPPSRDFHSFLTLSVSVFLYHFTNLCIFIVIDRTKRCAIHSWFICNPFSPLNQNITIALSHQFFFLLLLLFRSVHRPRLAHPAVRADRVWRGRPPASVPRSVPPASALLHRLAAPEADRPSL